MALPPDHAQRQRALNPNESFIVQAPAGSGKTELLVRRYLALLAKVDEPEQILAITFTKKATAEMRLRISNALKRIKENGDPEDNPEILAIADAALANDHRHNWHITANTRRLRIQTIDAFCNELVRQMPWSARFGSPPKIVDAAAPLYRRAANLALEHVDQDSDCADACEHLLAVVDADWNKARTLLADMLAKRDKWMRLTGLPVLPDRAHLEAMWQQVVDAELQRAVAIIPPSLQTELTELGAFAAGKLQASGKVTKVSALHDAQGFPEANHRYIEQWRGIADLLLTGTGTLRKTVNKNQGFPVDSDADRDVKTRMVALLGGLSEQTELLDELVDVLITVGLLPGAKFSDTQWRSIDALMRLLPLAAAELRLLFKAQNQADYIELTQRAALALGEEDAPSDLALAFDYRLGHVLMDEFQDTSSAHLDLLIKLTAGWQNGDGRTLFLVGDPMQSIYRFREAEVANFLQVQQVGLGDLRPESIVLKSNFRSAPALVEWFNQTFQGVMPPRDDIINGAVSYAHATAHTTDPNGAVHIHAAINRDAAREAEAVATLVKQAQQQEPEQSIAILGRSRGHLHDIAAALRRQGVAFQAVDMEKLNDRPAIRDLLAITRALAQPADRIAWLSLLRAPWCGLSLHDLTALAANHAATIMERWRDDAVLATLSEEGRARLKHLADSLAPALRRRGRIGIRQNVEAAWLCLGGPATVEASALDDCQRYFDLLSEMESGEIEITADNLKQATDNLWARGGVDARVQLLSIHKAKGLEFDAVFLPRLDRRPRSPEKTLLRWHKLPRQLLTAPLPSSTEQDDAFYPYLEHLEKIHTHNELCRLLYVACTRAKKTLHLFGSVEETNGELATPTPTSLLSLLWPALHEKYAEAATNDAEDGEVGEDGEVIDTNEPVPFQPQPVQKLPQEWRPPPLQQGILTGTGATDSAADETEAIEFSWAGETARVAGVVIHQILQRVDDHGWEHWCGQAADEQQTHCRTLLMENGIYGPHLEAALGRVTEAIEQTRNDPKAAWIFSAEHRDIKSEWPLSGTVDGKIVHIIIDRSFTDPQGIRWIIDFKSSRHEGANPEAFLTREVDRHQNQLSQYAAIVTQLQPTEIKLGLYFPALQGWREWAG